MLLSQGGELTFYAIPATVNNDPVDIVMQDRDTLNNPVDCRIKEGWYDISHLAPQTSDTLDVFVLEIILLIMN